MKETFSKEERLCHKKLIQQLFTSGLSVVSLPMKARWLHSTLPTTLPVQVMIAVPKSTFHNASDRNLIRRRIRESYRKNRSELFESLMNSGKQMAIVLIYTGKKILPYSDIEEKIILLLQRLKNENEKASG
ncbi:MAG: ribonuclease P protein component [Bacteroidales bacterium]|nr:ribonuclease P protein component [Bacteroidales bacterium]